VVIYDVQAIRIVTGVPVKVLGWIKSAVGFITTPAGPRKDRPLPEVPPEIDRGTAASEARPDTVEIAAESVSLELERRIAVEPENLAGVEPAGATGIEAESRISLEPEGLEPEGAQGEEEIDRRRGIVRAFFNDYWSSLDDKPASFAERLDGAEGYINERVAARGETWRLDRATREQLGLPRSRKK
jgi:hypothetical protein